METKSKVLKSDALKCMYVMTSLERSTPCESLETCKAMYGTPSITFTADVSGSMIQNMERLVNSLLALIDLAGPGTQLKVVLFDEIATTIFCDTLQTDVNSVKQFLRRTIINCGKSTNLELALKESLSFEENNEKNSEESSDPKHFKNEEIILEENAKETLLLFASDGMSNMGISSSYELIEYARSFSAYSSHTIFTLGIKTNPDAELNSELLKHMALDSGGLFQLTDTEEGITKILGDILAYHYYYRTCLSHVSCTSANGKEGKLKTNLGKKGAKLRADAPFTLIWEFPLDAQTPFTFQFNEKERLSQNTHDSKKVQLECKNAEEHDAFTILGCCIISPALDKLLNKEDLRFYYKCLHEYIEQSKFKSLTEYLHVLQKCIDMPENGKEEIAEVSFQSYALSCGVGEVSLQATELQTTAILLSQAQHYEPSHANDQDINQGSEEIDSQKTVESESNKRLKISKK